MNKLEIEDFLLEAENAVFKEKNELSPPELNELRDIESSTTDPSVVARIKKIREEHYKL